MTIVVKFEAARDGGPMAFVDGKISFPDKQSGVQPQIGEIWEVRIAGTNPSGRVNFLQLVKKVQLLEWSWNDGMGNRSRHPACLVVAADGSVHRFKGEEIPGLVKVLKSNYTKSGKWSSTTYHCVSPQGTSVRSWTQSWDDGYYWPEASWEEALATVQAAAPQVDATSLEAVIRENWGKAAEKFDENRQALTAFAALSPAPQTMPPEVADAIQQAADRIEELEADMSLDGGHHAALPALTPLVDKIEALWATEQTVEAVLVPKDLLHRLMAGNTDLDAVFEASQLLK